MKPLEKLETNMYVCMPCKTLAIQINPEEEDVVEAEQLYSDGKTGPFKYIIPNYELCNINVIKYIFR